MLTAPQVDTSKSGSATTILSNRFGERYIHELNPTSFVSTDSQTAYRSHYGDSLFLESALYVIVGTDSGLLCEYVLNRDLPTGTRYIFVEVAEFLPAVRERVEPLLTAGRATLCTRAQWETEAEAFRISDYAYAERLRLVKGLCVDESESGLYRETFREIEAQFKLLQWKYAAILGTAAFVEKAIDNLGENVTPAIRLEGVFAGQTAVLLGGGPSLDEHIEWLTEHRDKLLLVAVSRIARRLGQLDIEPDIVVSVDPHPISFDVSKEMLRFSNETVFVHQNHVTPMLLGQWHGRSVFLGSRFPWKADYDEPNLLGVGPTVTNSAFGLLMAMGVERIVLVGVDHCYSREGFSHAEGSNERRAGPKTGLTSQLVETNGGWLAETDNPFFIARQNLEVQAQAATEHGIQVVNPSEGAAKMAHVDFVQTPNIHLGCTNVTAHDILSRTIPTTGRDEMIGHYRKVIGELEHIQYRLEKLEELCHEGVRYNKRLFGRLGKPADFRYKERMDKLEQRLNDEFPELTALAKSFGTERFIRMLRTDSPESWTDDEIEQAGYDYYDALSFGANRLGSVIRSAQRRLATRIAEWDESPDLDRIEEQWIEDRQPGRMAVLACRRPEAVANEDERSRRLAAEFERMMQEEDTAHMRRCRIQASVESIPVKARDLFNAADRQGLERILGGLNTAQGEEAGVLSDLVHGYLAELNGDRDGAISFYEKARQAVAVRKDASRRISIVALTKGDFDRAETALKELADLSPANLPLYGSFLRMVGRVHEAIDVYTAYLEKGPQDIKAMLNLAAIYQELGVVDGVRVLTEMVLATDPGNVTAKAMQNKIA